MFLHRRFHEITQVKTAGNPAPIGATSWAKWTDEFAAALHMYLDEALTPQQDIFAFENLLHMQCETFWSEASSWALQTKSQAEASGKQEAAESRKVWRKKVEENLAKGTS